MSTNPSQFTPGVQSLIPLLYVAWADRVLSPSELKMLKKKVLTLPFLTKEDLETLSKWSNPLKPPTREEVKLWELEMKRAAISLPAEKRKSMADLALAMGKAGAARHKDIELWEANDTRAALVELESILGLVDMGNYHSIFPEVADLKQVEEEECNTCFKVDKMTDLLDGEFADIRRKTMTLLKDPAFELKTVRNKEEFRLRVLEWCKLLADQGLGALAYPKEYGGEGSMAKYIRVFETMGYHDLSLAIKFGVQVGLWGGSVLELGTKRHHDKYLTKTGKVELLGCFAMTETGHGSNVRGLETTATYDPDTQEFIINTPDYGAGKEYIGNALHGEIGSVFCQLIVKGQNHGVHAVVVPLKDKEGNQLPGIQVKDCGYKLGLNGVDNGRIWFDNVRVPRENLLNRFGDVSPEGEYTSPIEKPSRRFFTMLGTLVGGRVSVPKAGLSAAKKGLTIAIKYALRRRQFGKTVTGQEVLLMDYPSHQRRLMPLLAKSYALHFALEHLAYQYTDAQKGDMRDVETMAAGLKSYATWHTTKTLQECREACGGKGYLAENQFADMKADSDIFTTFEGDNTVLTQLAAKGVLTDFRKSFSDEGMTGILRFVGKNISTTVSEMNPLSIRNTDEDHLLDPQFHIDALNYRRDRLVYVISSKIREKIKSGIRAEDAFMLVQSRVLALGEAYTEALVMKTFYQAIESADEDLQPILKDLAALYALHTLESRKGWFLEEEYFAPTKTKHISRMVQNLCLKLRKDAHGLVDAFAIPDELLAADIVT